ncbi:peptidase M36 [Thamnocephalis sphaerospora]|uniref:Extracellular metalloproteinase n=1 Tax=Thamnocephalis sphaerospora TaxID=78915 RepID=A0A4P9XLD4_9FUNG|nr:peptidase M36 [Thamnocephalis sphaerospora]|eukprot:RKP06674.1 peptidase M36 [Thamnocephalis sphaerospora]
MRRDKEVRIGEYVEPAGLRNYPYTSHVKKNPSHILMLNDNEWASDPHNIGEVWASMLFEMHWNLVRKLGFTSDKHSADITKGNTLALKLVTDGLMLQPCFPTFVDARNAIIQAEMILTRGEHRCELWTAFARRGLGLDAQTDRSMKTVVAGYAVPKECGSPKA